MKTNSGKTLALVAPGFSVAPECWLIVKAKLHAQGYGVKTFGQHTPPFWRFSASDQSRAQSLMDAFTDPQVDGIICMRGGGGCSRLLDHLDFDVIGRHRKPLIGYSDITALHMALCTLTSNPAVHGPMGVDLMKPDAGAALTALAKALTGDFDHSWANGDVTIKQTGSFSGALVGGNLTVLLSLMGTPEFHIPHGAVLFLEDVGEHAFRVDRAFVQLRRSGVLDRCGALLFGTSLLAGATDAAAFQDLVAPHFDDFNGPVVFNLPCGHERMETALPLGQTCHLNVDQTLVTLRFDRAIAPHIVTAAAV